MFDYMNQKEVMANEVADGKWLRIMSFSFVRDAMYISIAKRNMQVTVRQEKAASLIVSPRGVCHIQTSYQAVYLQIGDIKWETSVRQRRWYRVKIDGSSYIIFAILTD